MAQLDGKMHGLESMAFRCRRYTCSDRSDISVWELTSLGICGEYRSLFCALPLLPVKLSTHCGPLLRPTVMVCRIVQGGMTLILRWLLQGNPSNEWMIASLVGKRTGSVSLLVGSLNHIHRLPTSHHTLLASYSTR